MAKLFNRFRQWSRPMPSRPQPAARRSRGLDFEQLEERNLPTVIFTSIFGSETVNSPDGPAYQMLISPRVYPIYVGSQWTPSQIFAVNTYIQGILNSHYLDPLKQYGSSGPAIFGGVSCILGNVESPSQTILDAISATGGGIPLPGDTYPVNSNIYAIIRDPQDPVANEGGENDIIALFGALTTDYIIINTSGAPGQAGINLSLFGGAFSHEMAEVVSDPNQGDEGVQVTTPPSLPSFLNGGDQLADSEPEPPGQFHYAYRINGPSGQVVQPFWSARDNAFVVDDGNTQPIYLLPLWSTAGDGTPVFSGTYDLTIPVVGKVTFDETPSSGLSIDLNGEQFHFSGGIHSTRIVLGGPKDTVFLDGTVPSDPVTIYEAGPSTAGDETVNLTYGPRNVSDIQGDVSIYGFNRDTLQVWDDGNTDGQNWTLEDGSLTRTGMATVTYSAQQYLAITGGTGGNTFDVLSSPAGVTTNIYSDAVLSYNGEVDTVNIGSAAPNLGGTLANIAGTVTVSNWAGLTNLFLDESGDRSGKTFVVTNSSVRGTWGPGVINYVATPGGVGGHVNTLNIGAGGAGATFYVPSTAADATTTIDTEENTYGGTASVFVGDSSGSPGSGSLDGIDGYLHVYSSLGQVDLIVDDSADIYSQTFTLTSGFITGTWAPGTIDYTGGLVPFVYVYGGSGYASGPSDGDTYDVLSTPVDTWTLLTSDYTDPYGGVDYVTVGSNAPNLRGNLGGIDGLLFIDNVHGNTNLTLDDSGDANPETITVTSTSVTGWSPAPIGYVGGAVSTLTLDGGSGGNQFDVQSTAKFTVTTINSDDHTGLYSLDQVMVGSLAPAMGGTLANFGDLKVYNVSGSTNLLLDDSGDSNGGTMALTDHSIYFQSGFSSPGVIDYHGAELNALTLAGGTGINYFNVQSTSVLSFIYTAFFASSAHSFVTVGSKAPDLGVTLAGLAGWLTVDASSGKTTMVVDDSGDRQGQTTTVTNGRIQGTWSNVGIDYAFPTQGGSSVAFLGGNRNDVQNIFHILGTPQGCPLLLNTGKSARVNLGNGRLGGLLGAVDIEGGADANTITVNDTDGSGKHTAILRTLNKAPAGVSNRGDSWGQIRSLAPASINYDYNDTSKLTLDGGSGKNIFDVRGTGAPTTLNTGSGSNTINVGNGDRVDDLLGLLTVNGQETAVQTLNVNDQASTGSQIYTLTASTIQCRPSGGTINYTNLNQVTLNGSSGGSTYGIDLQSFVLGLSYTINGGKGKDSYIVGQGSKNVDSFQGYLTINGGGGADTLRVNDQDGHVGGYDVESSTIYLNPYIVLGSVWYSGLTNVVLNGSTAGGSTYTVGSTAAGTTYTINVGNSTDTLDLTPANPIYKSQGANLDTIAGPVTINGLGGEPDDDLRPEQRR